MQILILGASTRAAAGSALRAGCRPICCDRFADVDLKQMVEVLPIADYPRDLLRIVDGTSATPWLYTGALENYPNLLRRLSERSPLWGNGGDVIWKVRDPFQLQPLLEENGLEALAIRPFHTPPPTDGSWLIKPMHTAAGRLIRVWDGTNTELLNEPCWFQQRADGESYGAVFLASEDDCRLLGMTRQLLYALPDDEQTFVYCGSIGPVTLADEVTDRVRQFGATLHRQAGLRGLFGCDFIVSGQAVWLAEVNPRYVASVEVLELAGQTSLLAEHLRVFGGEEVVAMLDPPEADGAPASSTGQPPVIGKQIVYADRQVTVAEELISPTELRDVASPENLWCVPRIADVPAIGTVIESAEPICTVFVQAENEADCRAQLSLRVAETERRLAASSTES